LMDEGKILIANLSKGKIGEDNSRLLGALVITKLQLAAMSRVDIPEEKRRDFYLYVDEFQNFATDAFINILSEARKYRLCLTLANQYLSQLEEMAPTGKYTKVRDAIFGNVGTIICFRIGAEDAEFLEREFFPEFTANDLVNLTKYNIYLKLMIDGIAGRPFSAETLPPLTVSEKSNQEKIIKVSRERYSTPKKIIEEKIAKWTGVLKLPEVAQPAPPVLYDAQCFLCGKWTKVIFPPDGARPVYCKSCLKRVEQKRGAVKKPVPTISLEEATKSDYNPPTIPKEKIELLPFGSSKKEKSELKKPSNDFFQRKREQAKRREINIEELKKILENTLKKTKK